MDRTQFKQRMKSLKSYREQNPGKGYWDWKVEQFEGGGTLLPEIEVLGTYPRKQYVYDRANSSQANFIQRVKDINRNTIPDWEVHNAVATHKLSYAEDEGKYIVYPEVQEINGGLYDFTDPKNGHYRNRKYRWTDALDSAINRGDTLTFDRESDAKYFTEHYKEYYPSFEEGGEVESKYPQFINGQRVNRWTGQPIATGQATPVLDLRTAADFTPVGDALAVNDAYRAIKNRDWLGAGLSALAVAPFIPTVNKRYVQDAIDRALSRNTKNIQKATDLNNETYEVIQRLTDDPSYMNRANRVKDKYGDDYTQIYADLIDAYNTNPDILPKAMPTEFSTGANGRMSTTRKSTERHRRGGEFPKLGEYEYQFARDTDLPEGITVHETNHLSDFLKNKTSDADGNSNLFYQMRQSIKPYADGNNKYYGNMSEQKAYMNQLREYMYNRGLINNRDQQVDRELLQNTIDRLPSDMNSVKRASKQFKSMRQYVKWFNTIPLLGAGAVAANRYYTQQENK